MLYVSTVYLVQLARLMQHLVPRANCLSKKTKSGQLSHSVTDAETAEPAYQTKPPSASPHNDKLQLYCVHIAADMATATCSTTGTRQKRTLRTRTRCCMAKSDRVHGQAKWRRFNEVHSQHDRHWTSVSRSTGGGLR